VTADSGREGDGGNGPVHVTSKASSAGTRPTIHGSLSGSVRRVAGASALAQIFGQLVSFVQTVALARLLTPTQVGIFVAGTVLSGLLTNFVEGGLRAGLVQRQGDMADADETVFWATLMVGVAASLGCLATAPVIGIIFNSHAAGLVAAASAGVVFIHSLTNVPESVLQREFSVKRRLIVGPTVAVSYAVVSVTLAALGYGVWSMVAGIYVSYTAWVVSLWMITSWRPGRGHASFAMWRSLARFGFPLVLAMIGFRLRTAIEALVVGRVLSTSALGFFRYGQRIALIPQSGIIEVGAITLFPAFSRIADNRERLVAAYLRAQHWSMVGAAASTGLMIALGEPAVVVLFGERWRGAGVALVAMSGLSIGSAIAVVAQDVIKARGRTRLINWFTLADLFFGVGFLLVLIGPFGFVGASLYISLTSLVTAAIMLGLAQLVVTVPLRRIVSVLAKPIPSLLIATTATWWLEHDILRSDTRGPILALVLLTVDALVFCLVYLAVLTVFARSTVVTIVRIVPVLIARFRRRGAERRSGTSSPSTLNSPSNLAAYQDSGPVAEAIQLLEQTPAYREQLLGPDYPEIQATRENLAEADRAVDRVANAIPPEQTLVGWKAQPSDGAAEQMRPVGVRRPPAAPARRALPVGVRRPPAAPARQPFADTVGCPPVKLTDGSSASRTPEVPRKDGQYDRDVVAAITARDPTGIAKAYDRYAAALYDYSHWILHDSAAAARALKEIFVIAAATLSDLPEPSKLRPWLFALARNESRRRVGLTSAIGDRESDAVGWPAAAADDLSDATVEFRAVGWPAAAADDLSDATVQFQVISPLAEPITPFRVISLPTYGPGHANDQAQAELECLIYSILAGLELREREVIELSFRHDLDDHDLAIALGVSQGRAHDLASRAQGRLEEALGVLHITLTGREACPILGGLLADWDGQLTERTRDLVVWHIGQCRTCAYHGWGAMRSAAFFRLLPLAPLPQELREQVLSLCTSRR
jgi:RNA polymerase sigma factor (sigma-70 family)